jgi:hypothetical protein
MRHDTPRFTPGLKWHSVNTPSFFREISMPADPDTWTAAQMKALASLEETAESYGTHVTVTDYRRG